MSEGVRVCSFFSVVILLIAACVILGVSFAVISPTEAGLYYNPNSKTLDRRTEYGNGRHLVCPGCYFYLFPQTVQLFEFNSKTGNELIGCWTKDKQELVIEAYIQYTIDKDKIGEIFDKFRFDYELIWERIAIATIKETTKEFYTSQFFNERSGVANALKSAIVGSLETDEGITIKSVHLGEVRIPTDFENAVTTKVVTQQEAATVQIQRNVTLVHARTAVIKKTAEADASIILGKAQARAAVIREQAEAEKLKTVQKAVGVSLKNLQDTLGLSLDEVIEYKFSRMLEELDSTGELVVGFEEQFLSVKERV